MNTDINIESLESFRESNLEIKVNLNSICSEMNDMLSYAATMEYNVGLVEGLLSGCGVSLGDISVAVSNFKSLTNDISTELAQLAYKIMGSLPIFESKIEDYSKGTGEYDMGVFDGIDLELNDGLGVVSSVIDEIENNQIFSGIGFLLNCASFILDPQGSAEDYAGEKATNGLWAFIRGHYSKSIASGAAVPTWFNAGVGAIVAIGFTSLDAWLGDEGNWTEKDTERLLWDIASTGTSVAASTLVAAGTAALLSKAGGTIGAAAGPIGAGIGALVGLGVGWLIDTLGANSVGDDVIDRYIVIKNADGTEQIIEYSDDLSEEILSRGVIYEVPANGNGQNGTYDVMVSRFSNYSESKTNSSYGDGGPGVINSSVLRSRGIYPNEYYDMLYSDNFEYFDYATRIVSYDDTSLTDAYTDNGLPNAQETIDRMENVYSEFTSSILENCNSPEEVRSYVEKYDDNLWDTDPEKATLFKRLYEDMRFYGWDPVMYYQRHTDPSSYDSFYL